MIVQPLSNLKALGNIFAKICEGFHGPSLERTLVIALKIT